MPVLFFCLGAAIRYIAVVNVVGYKDAFFPIFEPLCRWDCVWYLNIAEQGYDGFPTEKANNVGNWGFFPLYPALVRALELASPMTTLQTATVTSLALTFAACMVAWPLLSRNRLGYIVYSAYFLAGPFSYHFATALTEPLFLLLSSLSMWALQRRSYLGAGLATALLSATRIVGVFMVFATVATMWVDHRAAKGRVLDFPLYVLKRPDLVLALLVSPLGLFIYMLFLSATVGDGFAFSNVQRAFGRHVDWPWLHWWDAATRISPRQWSPTSSQWSAMAVIVAIALTAVMALRRQYAFALFCLICILLPISAGMASIVRYSAALAPLVLTMASLVATTRAVTIVAIGIFLALCYVLTGEWVGGNLALV